MRILSKIGSCAVVLFTAFLLCAVMGAATPAQAAGWRPSCSPLIPPPCSDQGDATGAAVTSFNHNYGTFPGAALKGGSRMLYDPFGRPGLMIVDGEAFGYPNLSGEATPHCGSMEYMSMQGCTAGPRGPQGRMQCVLQQGNPMNLGSGNKFEEVTDFTTVGQSPLALTRVYNSDMNFVISRPTAYSTANTPFQSRFGNAWRSQYDAALIGLFGLSMSATQIDAIRPDGNPVHFAKSSGVWYVAYWQPSSQSWSSSANPRRDVDLRLSDDGTYWYIQDENDTVEKYDTTGKLLRITYRGGYYQDLTYDGSGNNTVVTDSFGRTLTFTYLANGLVDTVTDPSTGVTTYSYLDRSGITPAPAPGTSWQWALETVTYPDTRVLTYHYEDTDPINKFALTGITDENGDRYATWTYDSLGRVTSSQHAGGADLITIAYGSGTRTITNALGKAAIYNVSNFQDTQQVSSIDGQASAHCPASTVTIAYDANGFISQTTSGEGRINTYTNNSIGQQTSRTEGFGSGVARTTTTTWNSTWRLPDQIVQPNLTLDFSYDGSGRLSQFKQTDTTTHKVPYSTNGQMRTWDYTYYGNGLLNTVDGPLSGSGDTTTYTYDADGCVASITNVLSQVTTISSVNGWCAPLVSVDANSVTTNYGYDLRGRLTSVTVNPGGGQAVYGFAYDYAGNLTVITLPDSSTLTYAYDDAHRLTSITNTAGEKIEYTLDDLGGITQTLVKTSGGTIKKSMTATFDELGRMLTSVGAASQTTAYTYDKDDNQVTLTDPRSKLYGFAFDALNRLYQQTDPDTYVTATAFDAQDGVTSVTDARSLVTSYVRNGFGDAIRQDSPDTGITDFWYDANGAVTQQIDARGVQTDFTNDALGRVLTKSFPASSGENVTFTYDSTAGGNKGVGYLTGVTDQSGSKAFVINALGQTASQTDVIGSNSYTTAYTYDAAGNVLTTTYPSGRIVTYTRDTVGRITSVTTKENTMASPVNIATGVAHLPFGPLSGFTFGNGVVLTLTHDQDYQLTGIDAANGGTVIQDLTNGYDAAGNITSITDGLNAGRSQTLTYENLNRVATASGAYPAQSYTYDGVGNRLTRVLGGVTDTYAYSMAANRISTITTGANVRSFSYAASGQVTGDVRTPSSAYGFTVNNNGRNASASLNAGTVGTYLYNGFEQRAQKVAGGVTIQFVYDLSGHLIAESNGSGVVQREYIWLDDLPVAMLDVSSGTPVLYFIHADQLGTPQKLTNTSSVIVWDGVFDPFGNGGSSGSALWGSVNWGAFSWGTTTNNLNPLRFPGQYADLETALNQNWNRDYDPTTGRYIQSDPIGLETGINTYEYALANPILYFDTDGLAPQPPPGMSYPPFRIPGGPWTWSPDPRNPRGGRFIGSIPPGGGERPSCTFAPSGPNNPNPYWKTVTPRGQSMKPIEQRYNMSGNPITAKQAHPGPSPVPSIIPKILGRAGAAIGVILPTSPAY